MGAQDQRLFVPMHKDGTEVRKMLRPRFCQIIKDRIFKMNKNSLIIVCGETGSGKSYAALRMAEIIDPTFNIDRCVFDTESFLAKMKDGLDHNTLQKGSAVVYDEMGISHSNRNFYDSINKALNFVFQGFRRENLVVFMTVPKMKFVDSQIRDLIHYVVVPKTIDDERNLVWCVPYVVKQNPLMMNKVSDFYYMKPTIAGTSIDGTQEMDRFGLGLPSVELKNAYEQKKKEFMFNLYEEARMLSAQVKRKHVSSLMKGQSNNGTNQNE